MQLAFVGDIIHGLGRIACKPIASEKIKGF